MAEVSSLMDRIDAAFAAASEREQQLKEQQVHAFQERQQRLEQFTKLMDGLQDVWRPRLEALAEKFGERVQVQPVIEPGRRSASFSFQSELARIDLRFAVSPDADVRNVIVTYDLRIVPILMKFESHDEISFPLDAVDHTALGTWIDDRIVNFVKTYLTLHENQYYLRGHMVEDPIAKVQFPKYAAGAVLETGGKTYYFVDESTRKQFEQQRTK